MHPGPGPAIRSVVDGLWGALVRSRDARVLPMRRELDVPSLTNFDAPKEHSASSQQLHWFWVSQRGMSRCLRDLRQPWAISSPEIRARTAGKPSSVTCQSFFNDSPTHLISTRTDAHRGCIQGAYHGTCLSISFVRSTGNPPLTGFDRTDKLPVLQTREKSNIPALP